MATTSSLASPGIGSGLDVNAIVDKLMAVERRPLDLLGSQEDAVQSKISAFGTLKSGLAALQSAVHALATPAAFRAQTATVGDTGVASAMAGDGATSGRYTLEVSQLASSQKLVSAGFATTASTVGDGTLTFTLGTFSGGVFTPSATGGARTVTISPAQSSLVGIRDAVNAADIGVTASIVNDGSANGQRLVFTSKSSGAANSIKITASDSDGVDTDANGLSQLAYDPAVAAGAGKNLTEKAQALDALFKLDGIDVTSASNTVTDAIAGVTLTLAKTNVGTPTTVSVAQNIGPAGAAVSAFVKAYNDLQATIGNLTKYDASAKSASVLTGDATVRGIQSQVRALIGGSVIGASARLDNLSLVGIKTQSDGTLTLDAAKLNSALNTDPRAVERLFAATGTATDALVSFGGAGGKTQAGTYDVTVTQLATRGTLVGSAAAGLTISAGVNDTLTATIDGVPVNVTLAAGTYASAAALAAEVASKVNGALGGGSSGSTVALTEAGGVLTATSNRYGSASKVSFAGTAAAGLFGGAPTATDGLDVAGTIGGVAAVGSGQVLTGATGSPSEGLKLTIAGGLVGARGTFTYAQGIGYGLDQVLTTVLGSTGAVKSRTDGLQNTIKDMDKRKDALQARLDRVEQAYLRQFNALDGQLAALSAMSTYLGQQLDSLPKPGILLNSKD